MMLAKSKTLKGRLVTLTTLFVVNLVVVGAVGYVGIDHAATDIGEQTKSVKAVHAMGLLDMHHDGLWGVVYEASFYHASGKDDRIPELRDGFLETSKEMKDLLSEVDALDINAVVEIKVGEARPNIAAYIAAGEKVLSDLIQGNAKSEEDMAAFGAQFEVLEESLGSLGEEIAKHSADTATKARTAADRSVWLSAALIIMGLLAALLSSGWIIRDLSSRMNQIVRELTTEAEGLNSVARVISDSSQSLAQASTQQSTAIEETVTSMEEITSMISQTSHNLTETQAETRRGQQEAGAGKEVVAKMVASMQEIAAANEQLQTIVKVMQEIKSRTRVINDIAFETRLLSFNASIEAARAGAHGRGFAVVAEEVGNLANVSSKAADEVSALLDNSVAKVESLIEETKERVAGGQTNSHACQEAFVAMETSLEAISRSVNQIVTATREQEGGVKQTNQAMGEMERATQANSRSADSLAGNSGKLGEAARQVVGTIVKMNAMMGNDKPLSSATSERRTHTGQQPKVVPLSQRGRTNQIEEADANRPDHSTDEARVRRDDDRWHAA